MTTGSEPRTHTAAVGLTFDQWNAWRGAAKDAGYEHTSDWVRDVVAAATEGQPAEGDAAKQELARELASISAHLGALTDSLEGQPDSADSRAAREAADTAAAALGALAQAVIDRW